MDKMVSLIVSGGAITSILWWFFGKRQSAVQIATEVDGIQQIEITVDGGYSPQVAQIKSGVPARLIFNRKDPSGCLEEVLLPDFGISKMLVLGEKNIIDIGPQVPGEYKYTCGMQMFSGNVVVK
jgi:plastocyanin domain-containing protein